MEKYFIITIDTEADNQWDNTHECSTKNARYLPRFQELAEKYEFKPVWLTTYEMANDNYFVKYFKEKQDKGLCEIGMHLHAWNNPPEFDLDTKTKERSYLIEYPFDIMDKKIKNLDNLLTEKFGIKPISHRAGRWAMNDDYFKLLNKYGYKIDCSITPGMNWRNNLGETGMPGVDYSNELKSVHTINGILECPVTLKKIRCFCLKNCTNIKNIVKEFLFIIKGKNQWIRPSKTFDIKGIKKVINICNKNNEYIMFMIHSSELMPEGSPNFKTKEDIEKLYEVIEEIFREVKKKNYIGITLKEYYNTIQVGEKNG